MGLSIRITDADGVVAILADDLAGDLSRSDLVVNGVRVIQVEQLFRASRVTLRNRDNRQVNLSFKSKRIHGTPFDALLFALDHDEEVPVQGLIELGISDGVQTATRWLDNAAIEAVNIDRQQGASTWQSYRIVGQQLLKANPRT